VRRTLCLLALALLAGCGEAPPQPFVPARAAEAQHLELGWRETYPAARKRLVFLVDDLDVTLDGWSARVAVTNETGVPFETGGEPAELSYGLMLFANGDLEELDRAASGNALPAVRKATRIEPALPAVLEPGATWHGRLSAAGSLADGSWARVVFGPLRARRAPPQGIEPVVLWITDSAHRL
jgi:hypothetical protein